MKKRTLVKPGAREQMKVDPGTTQQNLVTLLPSFAGCHPKRSDGGDSVSAARDMERAMHLRQRIYASLSATMVAALLTLLCYGALPAASNASRSLPVQGRPGPPQPSESSTASETAAQQSQGLKRLAQQSQEKQASPQEEPQHSTAPAQQEGTVSPAAPADPQPQAEQTTGPHPAWKLCFPEARSKQYWPGK